MPLVRIDVVEGRSAEKLRELADVVQVEIDLREAQGIAQEA